MTTLYDNHVSGQITDNPLSSGATTINSAAFANLSAVTNPDIMWIVLDPEAVDGAPEIVKVTAHTAAATSVTVTRAQQGTSARAHNQNTVWAHAVTAEDLDAFAVSPIVTADITDLNVTTAKIADLNVTTGKINDLAVTTGKLAADAVTGAKIADDQIDSEHYVDGSIDTAHIADSQITLAKMAANSVDSDQYVDGSIDTAHLADDAVTAAKLEPAVPLGVMAFASVTATQGSITTVADLASLTVTFTAVSSRRYRVSAQVDMLSNVANDVATMYITNSSNTAQTRSTATLGAINTSETMPCAVVLTGLSGSVTYKLRAERAAGSGTLSMFASATAPAYILVEDIGAA